MPNSAHPADDEAIDAIALSCQVSSSGFKGFINDGVVPKETLPALLGAIAKAANPEETRSSVYDAVCSQRDSFADYAALKQHRDLSRFLGIDRYHPKVLVGIHELLAPFGEPKMREVEQLIDVADGKWRSFKRDMASARGVLPGLLDTEPRRGRATFEELLINLPFDHRMLKNTCADPVRGHRFDDVEPNWCDSASSLRTFRDLAVVGMIVLAARGKKACWINRFIRALRRLDILATIYSDELTDDQDQLSKLCEIYVQRPVHGGSFDSDRTRADTIASLKRDIPAIHDFLSRKNFDPIRGELDLIVPREINLGTATGIYSELRKRTQAQGWDARKKVTNPQNDTLNMRFRSMKARSSVMRLIGDAIRSRVADALETGRIVDCNVVVPTLDDHGVPTISRQVELFRIWPTELAMKQFGKKPRRFAPDAPITEHYIVEHVGTEPFGSHPENETWTITIAKARVHAKVARASAEVQAARHEAMRRFNLPGGRPTHRGLCVFERWKAQLAIAAKARGTIFVQVEEIEAAVRLAALACEISEQSRARFESIAQLRPKRFKRNDKGAATPRHSQDVLPKWTKGGNPRSIKPMEINISEASLDEMVSICELHMRAAGFDKFPVMKPLKSFEWKIPSDQYAFSWNGRVLDQVTVSHCLDLLQAGWKRLSVHDLRYCLSEEAALDGESEFVAQKSLGHACEKHTKDYRYSVQLAAVMQAEIDLRRDGTAGAS
ncbi:hypothetical protein E3U23_07510 [Erythrobacter litoralis]|nr:hypothetical protein [Erythrobacter litoralis]